MPNHCTNKLLIRGPMPRLEALLKQGKVIVVTEEEIFNGFVLRKGGTDELEFSLRGFVPPPDHPDYNSGGCSHQHTGDMPAAYLAALGLTAQVEAHPNCWYIWNRQNWGTKWDCYDVRITNDPDSALDSLAKLDGEMQGVAAIYFDTAWGPPMPVIAKIVDLYKDLDIDFTFMDEDMTGGGGGKQIYRQGKLIEERDGINDPEDAEFRTIARDLKGFDYEEWKKERAEDEAAEAAEAEEEEESE